MTVSNVGIASVLTDPFGKTATEIMSYLLEHTADSIDEKAVRKPIRKGAKAKSDEIIEAIKGYLVLCQEKVQIKSEPFSYFVFIIF